MGVAGQGVQDLMSGKASNWKDYGSAALGGGLGLASVEYIGPAGPALGAMTTETLKEASHGEITMQHGADAMKIGKEGAIGLATGLLPGLKTGNLGQGSVNALAKSMATKLESKTISSVAAKTFGKMVVGHGIEHSAEMGLEKVAGGATDEGGLNGIIGGSKEQQSNQMPEFKPLYNDNKCSK